MSFCKLNKESAIPGAGLGLFARKDIPKESKIIYPVYSKSPSILTFFHAYDFNSENSPESVYPPFMRNLHLKNENNDHSLAFLGAFANDGCIAPYHAKTIASIGQMQDEEILEFIKNFSSDYAQNYVNFYFGDKPKRIFLTPPDKDNPEHLFVYDPLASGEEVLIVYGFNYWIGLLSANLKIIGRANILNEGRKRLKKNFDCYLTRYSI